MITSYLYKKGGQLEASVSRAGMLTAIQDKSSLLWVDFEDPNEFEQEALVEIFNFHPLAVEDCVIDNPQPKIDDYGEYLFLVLHALTRREKPSQTDEGEKETELATVEL